MYLAGVKVGSGSGSALTDPGLMDILSNAGCLQRLIGISYLVSPGLIPIVIQPPLGDTMNSLTNLLFAGALFISSITMLLLVISGLF
jgi:hypothetical protein